MSWQRVVSELTESSKRVSIVLNGCRVGVESV